jgi:hypothetical protein
MIHQGIKLGCITFTYFFDNTMRTYAMPARGDVLSSANIV